MKKIMFLHIFIVMAAINGGYAQKIRSKKEAIKITKNSEILNIHRHARDKNEYLQDNVERFLVEVNRVIPLEPQKYDRLKSAIIEMRRDINRDMFQCCLIFYIEWRTPSVIPPVDEVLKSHFSVEEYETLSAGLLKNMKTVFAAYEFLIELRRREIMATNSEIVAVGHTVDKIFEYFNL